MEESGELEVRRVGLGDEIGTTQCGTTCVAMEVSDGVMPMEEMMAVDDADVTVTLTCVTLLPKN